MKRVITILVTTVAVVFSPLAAANPPANTTISPRGVARFRFGQATFAQIQRWGGKWAIDGNKNYGGGEGASTFLRYDGSDGDGLFMFVTPIVPGPFDPRVYDKTELARSKFDSVDVGGGAHDAQMFKTDRGTRLGMSFSEAHVRERGRFVFCPRRGVVPPSWYLIRQTPASILYVRGYVRDGQKLPVSELSAFANRGVARRRYDPCGG